MEGEISEKTRRVLKVILKAIGGLIAIGFGVYIAWYEFGTDIFSSIFFYFMMLGWLVIGIVFFIDQLEEATQETTKEKLDKLTNKIDELITEIRQDRNERRSKQS